MREMMFAELIQIRTEPGLRDALNAAARHERTTASEFLRRELRSILVRRGLLPDPSATPQGSPVAGAMGR